MATVEMQVDTLVPGDWLPRDEFIRRWEARPELKNAELIGGIVYMPSPLSASHSAMSTDVAYWLRHYARHTPGTEAGSNATWYMLKDAPQPDAHLRVPRGHGGTSWIEDNFLHGVPELIVEVCLSSTSYDLHQKMDLYRSAGVPEYLALLLNEREARWHRLVRNEYQELPVGPEGVIQSVVLPGLWLDQSALLEGDMIRAIEVLEQGLNSPQHVEFAKSLAAS